jgi:XTP/dITP diphosphohydrolase
LRILLASSNPGKIKELGEILSGLDVTILTLKDFSAINLPPEDAGTFAGNALIKARHAAKVSGVATIADDSGIEVDALGKRPGVLSARYAGERASDGENNSKLLAELEGVPENERGAAYKCVIAFVEPVTGFEATFEGALRGVVAPAPRGAGGFGYDPLFYVPELRKTAAELPPEVKNRISHRAMALEKLKKFLLGRYASELKAES